MQLMSVSRDEAEKVYIVVKNNEGDELVPGRVVEWSVTTTDSNQGYLVELVDAVTHTASGIGGHKVAGVVDSTISTGAVGRLQVFGPANVRAAASLDVGKLVAATNTGQVAELDGAAGNGIGLIAALVGWSLEAGPNATNSTVQLSLL